MSSSHGRLAPVALYASAVLQGLTVVSFPASSASLRALHGFSDAEYGAVFLPQVAATIVGSLLGGRWASRLGLKRLLAIAVASCFGAEVLLASTGTLPRGSALVLLLAGSGLMGFGFGLGAAPLNTLPARLFPRHADAALLAVHTGIGAGFCLGPLVASQFIGNELWLGFPISLACLALACLVVVVLAELPAWTKPLREDGQGAATPTSSTEFWAFLAIAVLYAFAEGTLSNWVVIFLSEERRLPESLATLALSAFWAALVAGRLLASLLVSRVAPRTLWLFLLGSIALSFVLMPEIDGAFSALVMFALAGLSCSAFFPLSVTLVARRFPAHGASTSSAMVAALMIGVGLGSFGIGALHAVFTLSTIYRLSAVYPVLALLVALVMLRPERATRFKTYAVSD